jgi:hypothetical protein
VAAFVEDQVREALLPNVTLAGDTEIVTVGATGAFTVRTAELLVVPPPPVQASM